MQQAIDEIAAAGDQFVTQDTLAYLNQQIFGSDPSADPIIEPTGDAPLGLDGNNVNMEEETGALGKNSMMYQLTAQMLASKYRQIMSILQNEGA